MPKRSRREFWRKWKSTPIPTYDPAAFWYLVAHRLAKQNREIFATVEHCRAQESKYQEIATLYSMGVNLERVSTLAIENQRLRDGLDRILAAGGVTVPQPAYNRTGYWWPRR